MTRIETHQHFVTRFCGKDAERVTEASLDAAEDQLGILFSSAYREFVLARGAVRSHTLLDLIVDAEADLWEIASFYTPLECVETTDSYRSAGMSERLIAIAGDSAGNVFCFDERDLLDARPDDVPVWFFDHDLDEDKQLAVSFDAWLASYFSLP